MRQDWREQGIHCAKCEVELTGRNTLHGRGLCTVHWCDLCWERITKPKARRPKMPRQQSGMFISGGKT